MMTVTRAWRSSAVACTVVVSSLLAAACDIEGLLGTKSDPIGEIGTRMSVVNATTETVFIEARWSAASDESGISRYEWINWRSTPDTVVAEGSTALLADTFSVSRPATNETATFGFQVRAVDGVGNAGDYSAAHMWSLSNEDVTPPPPPDSVVVDTLIASVSVWPQNLEVEAGSQVQFYSALLVVESWETWADTSVACNTPPAAPGALYDSGTFCCGCDSAAADLPWSNQAASSAPKIVQGATRAYTRS